MWPARRSTPPSSARSGLTWTGPRQVVRRGRRVGQHCMVRARSAALMPVLMPVRASTRDRVRGAHPLLVRADHQRDLEAVEVLAGHRHADVARGVAHHERDQLGRRLLGGEDEVALVLAVLVVDDDDGLAGGDVGDGALDRVEPGDGSLLGGGGHAVSFVAPAGRTPDSSSFSTCLASTSTSRFTGSPGPLLPSVVSPRVVGIRLTSNQSSVDGGDGQRDAVDGDGALLDDVPGQAVGQRHPHDGPVLVGRDGQHLAGAVDVALHDVAAEAVADADGALEVDRAARHGRRARSGAASRP